MALIIHRIPKLKRTLQKNKEKVVGESVNLKSDAVNANEAEEKENIASVEKTIMAEEDDKMVEGKEDDDNDFLDSLLISQEDPDTKLEPESHKESMEEKNDNDDDQHNVDTLTRRKKMGSLEIRDEEKQTPIPTPPRTNLYSDKEQTIELTETNIYMSNLPSLFKCAKHLKGVIKDDSQSQAADPDMWKVLREKFEKSSAPSESYKQNFFCKIDHDDHPNEDVPPEVENGAKRKKISRGSKSAKDSSSSKQPVKEYHKTSSVHQKQQDYDGWSGILEIDEYEEIFEEASPTFLNELKSLGDKKVSTITNNQRMKATLKDMMRNQFRTAKEYAYHIE
ncbi:hypothetical protein Tco_0720105 [Tanacetum coccineum]